MLREAKKTDKDAILNLYLFLHEDRIPKEDEHLQKTWEQIINDENYHLIIYEIDGQIVSSCICVIIPNLTRNVRPYALLENVVTHKEHRNKGYATACLNYAKELAQKDNCYKMMLLTGAKDPATIRFYESVGFNCNDKTAFVQWL